MNFANELDSAARNHPETIAVTDRRRELTYRELADETDDLAGALAELGVEDGERIALYMPGSTTFVAAYFGVMKLGAIPVPLNLRFGYHELDDIIDEVGATTVIGNEDLPTAPEVLEADALERRIVRGSEVGLSYEDLVADAAPVDEPTPREDDHLAEIMYTRGTTDRPMGVLHTHGNLLANARAIDRYLQLSSRTSGLAACPPSHVFGLHGTVTPLLCRGGKSHFPPEWDESVYDLLSEREVTLAVLVPGMLKDILEHGAEQYDFGALEQVVVAGGPIPKDTLAETERVLGCPISAMYGTTETMPATALDPVGGSRYEPRRVGRPAAEVVDLRIEDPRDGTARGPGERGELLWRGSSVTPGYWNAPEANDDCFVERAGEYWFRSGDVGYLDQDGYLFVEGRTGDMLLTDDGVYLRHAFEEALYNLAGVVEAAIVTRSGDPHVVVMRKPGETSPDAATVKSACREVADGQWEPELVEFVDELPRTAVREMSHRSGTGGDWFDRTDQGVHDWRTSTTNG